MKFFVYLIGVLAVVLVVGPADSADPEPARERWSQLYFSGQMAYEKKDYGQAERLFNEALKEAESGNYDGLIGMTLFNLARTYHQQNQYDKAEPLYKRAFDLYNSARRRNSFYGIYVLKGYAKLLRETGRPGKAKKIEALIQQ